MGITDKVARSTDPHELGRHGVILNMATVRAPERTPDQPCVDCLDQSLAAEQTRPTVPRRVAFWLLAFVLTTTMLGTTLPTPLYVIYQGQWHFSAAVVAVTFAVYAAGSWPPCCWRGGPRTRPDANRCWPQPWPAAR